MDLINFVLKLISWDFHSTCNSLAELLRYFVVTLVLQHGVHFHIEGASYMFDYFFLMDINLVATLHLYLALNMHLGNYHLALAALWSLDCLTHLGLTCCIYLQFTCSLALQ